MGDDRGIAGRIRAWFRRAKEPPLERPRDVPFVPPAPDGARPMAGTMCVEPLRPPDVGGYGAY
ncbi:hypothetical protein GCM10009809_29010 [Isoptericola hypogeus]|uniref:Uncharacterized protein n=1 Tax=Isoptericola hypogeus TaxID=300179 RepID=A0ABN2JLX4_9MICO